MTASARAPSIRRRRRSGIALVEFVLMAPVLLLLLLMVAELGRALYQYTILTQAVRDATRYYASHFLAIDANNAAAKLTLETAVQNIVMQETTLLPGMNIDDVFPNADDPNTVGWVTVTATYNFQPLPGDPLTGILNLVGGGAWLPLPLTATLSLRAI